MYNIQDIEAWIGNNIIRFAFIIFNTQILKDSKTQTRKAFTASCLSCRRAVFVRE